MGFQRELPRKHQPQLEKCEVKAIKVLQYRLTPIPKEEKRQLKDIWSEVHPSLFVHLNQEKRGKGWHSLRTLIRCACLYALHPPAAPRKGRQVPLFLHPRPGLTLVRPEQAPKSQALSEHCLHGYTREDLLKGHKPECRGIGKATVQEEMPKGGEEQALH